MSDGTTQISDTLTAETAQLLARLHPNMFPGVNSEQKAEGGERLTALVQSVLSQDGKRVYSLPTISFGCWQSDVASNDRTKRG